MVNGQYRDVVVQDPYQPAAYAPGELPPEYVRDPDLTDRFGSIIKDLTDTEMFLREYELRLMGKKENERGDIVDDGNVVPIIKSEKTAREFVDMIRSVANQNTHFTGFESGDVYNSLNALNYTMNRWLMFQAGNVPLRYRQKLSLEAMNIAKASLHKAKKHLILTWSKGNIREGQQITHSDGEKKGFMNFLFPRRGR